MRHLAPVMIAVVLSACAPVAVRDIHDRKLSDVESLASTGDRVAIHDLCYRYKYGEEAPLNYQKALPWCSKAAALGIDSAQVLLGEMYYNGQGVKQDYAAARALYQAAADQEHPHALLMLFYIYSEGLGVTRDQPLAESYLALAADLGYTKAIELRGR